MAFVDLQEQANFTRLLRLLIDKGTEALRSTFDAIHAPVNLPVALNANKRVLFKIINRHQWDLLFPQSGNPPDSKNFDMTLLTILLLNICGFSRPAAGWGEMPPVSDISTSADIVRVKIYRNEYFRHITSTQLDKETYEQLWQEVSKPLVRLGIGQREIDYLKTCPLSPEEETSKEKHNLEKEKRESPESWAWEKKSVIHREKFIKLLEYGRDRPQDIQVVNDVRFCCSTEVLIGRGSDATKVFVGLSKDGYEKAVKRLENDDYGAYLAEQEKKILNAIESKYVVKYRFLDKSNKDWLFLIMDLCEETLEEFVTRSSLDGYSKIARDIIEQVLKGLADLHRDPIILHRDLKPRNILRDVHGNWLLADFGISRILPRGVSTLRSKERGTDHWKAVESCSSNGTYNNDDVRYKKKSDIQVAGMVAFYIVTKGDHPFGEQADQLRNLLDGRPVGLDKLKDPAAKDLISWMLSHDPKDRPSAEQALKHPYLQSEKQQFEMLCKVGNEVEIKTGNVWSDIVRKLNSHDPKDWKTLLKADVLTYLCINALNGRTIPYSSSWTDCLRLIRNVKTHWRDRPLPQPEQFYVVGDPQEYFLNVFSNLPVVVHGIVRSSDWKERPDLKEYFT